ncbi:hypothetical protein ACFC1R_30565 [Kitasatospora sp. NPDC056138]|uniref:hypothetical protein n=1 Tax=Kitasatospora sp. NPDC056138 TaxID=3345724 RepID=UPI0035D91084
MLVSPADPASGRLVLAEDGWVGCEQAHTLAGPHLGWLAVLRETHLAIRRPGGPPCFDGEVGATRESRKAARSHRAMLLSPALSYKLPNSRPRPGNCVRSSFRPG